MEEAEESSGAKVSPSPDDNIKDFDAALVVRQMASGDPADPVVKAIAAYHNPKFTGASGVTKKVDTPEGAKQLAAWVKEFGPEKLVAGIKRVQGKLPSKGLPKHKMPALEPDQVEQVEDALSPGGKMNVDLTSPYADGEEDFESWFEDMKNESRSIRGWLFREEKFPQQYTSGMPKDVAQAFLTKGHKDEEVNDDTISVKQDEPFDVSKMIPTQSNVLIGKALSFALGGGFGGQSLGAYITADGEILDGHHRWAGTLIVDPNAKISGHQIVAKSEDVLPALTSIGNALGNKQKGMPDDAKNESLDLQRWRRLAGLLND
jgi:hypothetical protein